MERIERVRFTPSSSGRRLRSMLKVDSRRMFTMPLLYIMVGICLVMPILILVMTTMMDGTVSVDPNTGVETTIEAFESTWQAIAPLSGAGMDMSLTGMCNSSLVYFLIAVLVCLFVSGDFKSGYAKNLFAVRPKKGSYILSKTLMGLIGGVLMMLAFFAGAMLGGAISGLPFDTGAAGTLGAVMCMLSRLCLVAVFVPIYVLMSAVGRQKTWLALVGSLCVGMLFFTIVPMMAPLDASAANFAMCLVGGALFSAGIGAVSTRILGHVSLV